MKDKILLLFLILLFLFTRLYRISSIPYSLYWDEASIGYNAYSVLKTGSDEWGEFLPLHFRAFGEFKLPVYIYSVVPFVHFLGLNEVSVRLPSVFYSLFSLILIYFIAVKIFKDKKIALFSSFSFAVLPWNFIFSRTGYEATAGLFFYLSFVFVWFYFEPFNFSKNQSPWKRSGILSAFVFLMILSVYSYNSFRFWTPITFLFLSLCFYLGQKSLSLGKITPLILSFLILVLSFYPIYRLYKFDYGASRYQAVGLQGSFIQKSNLFLRNYLSHFSFDFLFRNGDSNLRSQLPGFGQLYVISLPFLILGIVSLWKRKDSASFFVLFLLLIAPVPASITKESPHSLRSILFAFVFPIVISLGVSDLAIYLKKLGKFLWVFSFLVYFSFFSFYFYRFVNSYPTYSYSSWQGEYKQLFLNNQDLLDKAKKVVVADSYAQPYIFALFYGKIDPLKFGESVVYNPQDKWGFSTVYSFDKFIFKEPQEEDLRDRVLLFSSEEITGLNKFLIRVVDLSSGKTAFWVYGK